MIYLVSGENEYGKEEYILSLRNKFKNFSYSSIYSGKDDNQMINELDHLLFSVSLFEVKGLIVVVNRYDSQSFKQYLDKIFDKIKQRTDTILILKIREKLRINSKLLKVIENKNDCFFANYTQSQLSNIARKELTTGISIDSMLKQRILNLILEKTNNDPFVVQSEAKKVRLYLTQYPQTDINKIDEIITQSNEETIWNYLYLLTSKKGRESSRLIIKLLEKGQSEFYILSMIAWQIRLILISELSGITKNIMIDFGYSPISLKKALEISKYFKMEKIISIYDQLIRTEAQIKTGKLPAKLGLVILSNTLA